MSRWCAFFLVGQVMIGDDYVEPVVARPIKWFMRADAAIDTNDEFVAIGHRSFERGLLNAVTFSKAMGDVKTGVRAEQFERAQQHCGSSCAIDVVIAVDQNRLPAFDCALQASHSLFHAEHAIRLVQLIISWRKEDPRRALVGVPTGYQKSSQDW
jgi:hypothetical protein